MSCSYENEQDYYRFKKGRKVFAVYNLNLLRDEDFRRKNIAPSYPGRTGRG